MPLYNEVVTLYWRILYKTFRINHHDYSFSILEIPTEQNKMCIDLKQLN